MRAMQAGGGADGDVAVPLRPLDVGDHGVGVQGVGDVSGVGGDFPVGPGGEAFCEFPVGHPPVLGVQAGGLLGHEGGPVLTDAPGGEVGEGVGEFGVQGGGESEEGAGAVGGLAACQGDLTDDTAVRGLAFPWGGGPGLAGVLQGEGRMGLGRAALVLDVLELPDEVNEFPLTARLHQGGPVTQERGDPRQALHSCRAPRSRRALHSCRAPRSHRAHHPRRALGAGHLPARHGRSGLPPGQGRGAGLPRWGQREGGRCFHDPIVVEHMFDHQCSAKSVNNFLAAPFLWTTIDPDDAASPCGDPRQEWLTSSTASPLLLGCRRRAIPRSRMPASVWITTWRPG